MIKVGLFGFGRTGKLVAAEIIKEPHCNLEWVIRSSHENEGGSASDIIGLQARQGKIISKESLAEWPNFFEENPVDIIIDFSDKSGYHIYQKAAATLGIKLVTAISKYDQEDIDALVELGNHTSVVLSPNITLGINLVLVLSEVLQRIIPDADIEIIEEHFREKPEVSGTAIKIANRLGLDPQRHVNSIRVGGIVGKHEVIFGMPNQLLRLTHESNNRSAFGRGAVFAAKWIQNKPKGVYDMESIIRSELIKNIHI